MSTHSFPAGKKPQAEYHDTQPKFCKEFDRETVCCHDGKESIQSELVNGAVKDSREDMSYRAVMVGR